MSIGMSTTQLRQHIRASRALVYGALLDAEDRAAWMVPDGMTSEVHRFDAREGGAFRISLTYRDDDNAGKSGAHTDTFHGHFVALIPDHRVVERTEFETDDPAMQGEMTLTYTLTDVDGGTDVVLLHEGLPAGVAVADNEEGSRMSLAKLAKLVEARASTT